MADVRLDDLLQAYGVARATQWTSGGPLDEIESARAAIVAHVREREVELMALAMFARQWRKTDADPLALWANHPPQKAPYLDSARALRDAYDKATPPRAGEGER